MLWGLRLPCKSGREPTGQPDQGLRLTSACSIIFQYALQSTDVCQSSNLVMIGERPSDAEGRTDMDSFGTCPRSERDKV